MPMRLFAVRAGSLFLNERVVKLAPERGAACRSCNGAKETTFSAALPTRAFERNGQRQQRM